MEGAKRGTGGSVRERRKERKHGLSAQAETFSKNLAHSPGCHLLICYNSFVELDISDVGDR